MKNIFLLFASAFIMLSCAKEECPELYCDAEISLNVLVSNNDPALQNIDDVVNRLDLFLVDEKNKISYGPIKLDVEQVYSSKTLLTDALVPEGHKMYNVKVVQKLPFGNFKMWIWANVHNPEVYSFDKLSVNQKDNIAAGFYQATKPQEISLVGLNQKIDAGNLNWLVSPVRVTYPEGDVVPVSLLFDSVCKSVNANGEYSSLPTTLEYRSSIAGFAMWYNLFPQSTQSNVVYTYTKDGVQNSSEGILAPFALYNTGSAEFPI